MNTTVAIVILYEIKYSDTMDFICEPAGSF